MTPKTHSAPRALAEQKGHTALCTTARRLEGGGGPRSGARLPRPPAPTAYLGVVRTGGPGWGAGPAGRRSPPAREPAQSAGARRGSGRPRSALCSRLRQGGGAFRLGPSGLGSSPQQESSPTSGLAIGLTCWVPAPARSTPHRHGPPAPHCCKGLRGATVRGNGPPPQRPRKPGASTADNVSLSARAVITELG